MKKNLTLILGLAIPVVVVIIVALFVVVPNWLSSPNTDFLYLRNSSGNYYDDGLTYNATDNCYWSATNYRVVSGKIVSQANNTAPRGYALCDTMVGLKNPRQVKNTKDIYRYDVVRKTSTKLSLEDAQKLTLSDAKLSPDGYEISNGGYRGGSLFGEIFYSSSNRYSRFLVGHGASHRIELDANQGAYYDYYSSYSNFSFLGWVVSQ